MLTCVSLTCCPVAILCNSEQQAEFAERLRKSSIADAAPVASCILIKLIAPSSFLTRPEPPTADTAR